MHQADAVSNDKDPLHAVYCSQECLTKSKVQSHRCLFLPESLLPPEIDQSQSTSNPEARHEGQQAFAKYLKESKKTHPLLVARFAARQIATEIAKLTEQVTKQTDDHLDSPGYVEKGGPEYALGDHFERLRYVDAPVPEEETKVIQGVFSNSLPGLDEFLTDERHAIMLSKVAHNAIGIAFSGGRDDRVSACLTRDVEAGLTVLDSPFSMNALKTRSAPAHLTVLAVKLVAEFTSSLHT